MDYHLKTTSFSAKAQLDKVMETFETNTSGLTGDQALLASETSKALRALEGMILKSIKNLE